MVAKVFEALATCLPVRHAERARVCRSIVSPCRGGVGRKGEGHAVVAGDEGWIR